MIAAKQDSSRDADVASATGVPAAGKLASICCDVCAAVML